jgi:hypothetical protein
MAVADPSPRFEVRGLELVKEPGTYYGVGTTERYRATVVQLGNTTQPYLVLVRTKVVSGGDPERSPTPEYTELIPVIDGTGDYSFNAGFRTPSETWPSAKVEVTVIGTAPLKRQAPPAQQGISPSDTP